MATQSLRHGLVRFFRRRRPYQAVVSSPHADGLPAPRNSIHTARSRLTRIAPSALYVDIFMLPKAINRAMLSSLCRLN